MVRVMIRFKNQCAVSFKCSRDDVEMVVKIMLKELKRSEDDIDEIKVTEIED